MNQAGSPAGLLVGGTDSGSIIMYNANKIISGDKDNVLFCENSKHTGTGNSPINDTVHLKVTISFISYFFKQNYKIF